MLWVTVSIYFFAFFLHLDFNYHNYWITTENRDRIGVVTCKTRGRYEHRISAYHATFYYISRGKTDYRECIYIYDSWRCYRTNNLVSLCMKFLKYKTTEIQRSKFELSHRARMCFQGDARIESCFLPFSIFSTVFSTLNILYSVVSISLTTCHVQHHRHPIKSRLLYQIKSARSERS